jgi:hypothetical protein
MSLHSSNAALTPCRLVSPIYAELRRPDQFVHWLVHATTAWTRQCRCPHTELAVVITLIQAPAAHLSPCRQRVVRMCEIRPNEVATSFRGVHVSNPLDSNNHTVKLTNYLFCALSLSYSVSPFLIPQMWTGVSQFITRP